LGSYQFDTEGEYTVGIKVSDGNGGVTYGSFEVSAVPEPASMVSLSLGAATLLGFTWRRRKQAAPAAA
jgi:hypothetical protein